MPYKKFQNGDVLHNTIKAKPRFEFKIWNGKALVNSGVGLAELNGMEVLPPDYVAPTCQANAFDFSCAENSYNLSII